MNIRKLIREVLSESAEFDLSNDELRDIAKQGLTGDYYSSGCWDDNEDDIDDEHDALNNV